jgi:hypothetical protein
MSSGSPPPLCSVLRIQYHSQNGDQQRTSYLLCLSDHLEGVVSGGEISHDLAADIRGLWRCKKYFAAYNYSEGFA